MDNILTKKDRKPSSSLAVEDSVQIQKVFMLNECNNDWLLNKSEKNILKFYIFLEH